MWNYGGDKFSMKAKGGKPSSRKGKKRTAKYRKKEKVMAASRKYPKSNQKRYAASPAGRRARAAARARYKRKLADGS